MEQRENGALERATRRPEVEQMEGAARAQQAPHVAEGVAFLLRGEVVDHQRGDDAVEARGGERRASGVADVELERDARLLGLAARERERLRVRIEADHLRGGLAPQQRQRELAGAATEVEHALAGLDLRGVE